MCKESSWPWTGGWSFRNVRQRIKGSYEPFEVVYIGAGREGEWKGNGVYNGRHPSDSNRSSGSGCAQQLRYTAKNRQWICSEAFVTAFGSVRETGEPQFRGE